MTTLVKPCKRDKKNTYESVASQIPPRTHPHDDHDQGLILTYKGEISMVGYISRVEKLFRYHRGHLDLQKSSLMRLILMQMPFNGS
jgi:hypothetical protein